MKRAKLTVRPTGEELTQLHERAGRLGYNSLSAYLIDCGLSDDGVLPRERRTLESLLLHVSHLTATIEEERRKRKGGVLERVPHELLNDVTRRSSEALRLINVILDRACEGEAKETKEREEAA
ncbi:MAG TPA: hypothetical protein VGN95_14110 [Pyrinomonadaceae bacterium]|jgi:hypothetical protein|nr:hypothetical protein [Pyrinomonadaceae bacterium]